MKKTLYSFLLIPLLSVSITSVSYANTPTHQCKIIHWKDGSRYTITGSLHLATHITFPVPKKADPVVGNSELWTVESAANHVFLKPNSETDAGKITTLTYIGQNNRSYEFLLKRVDQSQTAQATQTEQKTQNTCFIVQDSGALLNNTWRKIQTPDQQKLMLLKAQLNTQHTIAQQTQKQIVSQQRKALNAYRKKIHTDYTWPGKKSAWHKKLINSVYDDGRWTYIRLNEDNQGVMAIYGLLAGQHTLLEFQYDPSNKIYQIAGIYPKLVLVYHKQHIRITRKD